MAPMPQKRHPLLEAFLHYLSAPRLGQVGLDLLVSGLAFGAAYLLRFEGRISDLYLAQLLSLWPVMIALRFLWRLPWGVHQQLWRYVSLREAIDITLCITAGSLCFLMVSRLAVHQHVPWGVLSLDWGLNVIAYVGLRGIRRAVAETQRRNVTSSSVRRLLLVGAGQSGLTFAKELQRVHPHTPIVGFVDDDPHKRHSTLYGLPVLGTIADLPQLVEAQSIDEIILCVPSASSEQMRRILSLCHKSSATIKTMPALKDLLSGDVSITRVREVDIEDLLGRSTVSFDRASVAQYLADRVVLVTGAGGSIGSELCRQIAQVGPKRLILVGRGEFSIYSIDLELRERFPTLEIIPLIADVRDVERLERIFNAYRPEVVFHAAAHKHVPLMERNPGEAVLNNIFGTRNVATLADRYRVETFVLISTDKAVNPTNVMGATKRAAEMVVQELATRSATRFMCVRFGNVLGSRGSVIPLFKRQIAAGGPITLTHPDVIRYFMTIPEASQLVLVAGGLGLGGEVFVLNMGEPVRIIDLANDLIRLSGLEPEIDIAIQFTGLRPGEKLYEELLTAEEGISSTRHQKIFIAKPEPLERQQLEDSLSSLVKAANQMDDASVRKELQALVSTYQCSAIRQ